LDGSISLGQTVTWNGKQAIVRYIGEVKFASGEWLGLELAEAKGFHDGSALGVRYFECAPERAVFAQAVQLQIGDAALSSAQSPINTASGSAPAVAVPEESEPAAAGALSESQEAAAAAKTAAASSPSGAADAATVETQRIPQFDPAAQDGVIAPLGFFDPLGFAPSGDEGGFRQSREAELKHGRVAMVAFAGLVAQHFVRLPSFEKVPSGVRALTSVQGLEGLLVLTVVLGVVEVSGLATPIIGEDDGAQDFRNKELSNGRLAMLGVFGIICVELATGKDVVQQLDGLTQLMAQAARRF